MSFLVCLFFPYWSLTTHSQSVCLQLTVPGQNYQNIVVDSRSAVTSDCDMNICIQAMTVLHKIVTNQSLQLTNLCKLTGHFKWQNVSLGFPLV